MPKPHPLREYFDFPGKHGINAVITTNLVMVFSAFLIFLILGLIQSLAYAFFPTTLYLIWNQYVLRYKHGLLWAIYKSIVAVISFFTLFLLVYGVIIPHLGYLILGVIGHGLMNYHAWKFKRKIGLFDTYTFIDPFM